MMAVGLHGDHDLLQACQDLFRLGQCQPQLRDIAEITKRSISITSITRGAVDRGFNQAPAHGR